MMGQVTDKITGKPLQFVKVTVVFEDDETLEFTKITTKTGRFQFKNLPEGKCKVIFVKNYYETLTVNSEINPNNLIRLVVQI